MTGRATGSWAGYDSPDRATTWLGRGGRSRARGHHRWPSAVLLAGWLGARLGRAVWQRRDVPVARAPLPPESLESLQVHGQALAKTLAETRGRIRDMEAARQ